ncbi:MAG: alpha/beta hydrolase [Arsenophonus sp.]
MRFAANTAVRLAYLKLNHLKGIAVLGPIVHTFLA